MSKTHRINLSYSGGGDSAVSSQINITGTSELNFDLTCNGSATTTLTPPVVMDPDSRIQSYCFLVTGGNATLAFTPVSGAATTIGLVADVPAVAWYDSVTDLIAGVPTSSETYTLSVRNANSDTITFDARMCLQ